ncbi:asparagine synthase (glutamine-hydrolyzing) [Terrimonas sp.]|uniref:asparagine synthase (glutamine-hydrolyzing) n=1 Tax=Terrimonas sp. TaxID=1914338 RepID=UPI000D52524A|nr:asparagine synthase (glutamine-hydrolyzing) [Terrimonas sp.]PVD52034.1 asparagine synthase (glutamine-hydrolyzing) [Terrimonas sp.]
MCGIAGVFYFNKENSIPGLIKMMNHAMAHRGPNAEGIWSEGTIGLGHRRLSIIDLSTAANQPYHDNSKRFVTVFNGEIYNYQSVKEQLQNYDFKTTSDTETLVAAYAAWGTACLQHLKGMFAFAIWDRETKELCLVRDRMGVKPLYYYMDEEKIIFASEIRALLATGLIARKVNPEAIHEYLSYQSVSSPLSMIEGIQQLEAGSWMKIKNGRTEITKYWNPWDSSNNDYPDLSSVKKKVFELLGESVQKRLVSDVPVGAFLSGGIDSSIVVGLMAEVCGIRPATFNISFAEKEFDESLYAEMIAKKFNAHHTRIQLSPQNMLDELENALGAMDTPSGDGINTYVVSKAIKNAGITVALSGVGGDELFAGYPIFEQFRKINAQKKWWDNTALIRKMAAVLLPGKLSNKQSRMRQLLQTPTANIEYIYPLLRQLITPEQVNMYTTLNHKRETEIYNRLRENGDVLRGLPVLSQVSVAEYMGYTQQTLLKDTDQMSMAVALEVREPYLDTDLVQYVLGIPDQYKQPVYPKSLLVESVKPLLPDEIVFRKKQGFVFPWQQWMRGELKTFCSTHLNRLEQRAFINGKSLSKYWNQFLKGDDSIRWMDIWIFVVLEYWLEKNGIE